MQRTGRIGPRTALHIIIIIYRILIDSDADWGTALVQMDSHFDCWMYFPDGWLSERLSDFETQKSRWFYIIFQK